MRLGALALSLAAFAALPSGLRASPPAARAACKSDRTPSLPSRRFTFPRDDGAHDEYAVEWWRTFGRVTDEAGKRFDFSVNISRSAIDADASTMRTTATHWFARRLVTTSFELLDEQTLEVKRGIFVDREGVLGARVAESELSIVERTLAYAATPHAGSGAEHFTLSLRDANDTNAISVGQAPIEAALPLGPGGVMQTGSCTANEAYAYAYTRNATNGVLRFDGVDHRVSGSTWFEHEFARQELAASDAGWSRFEVQFDDGRDVDARFTRDANGTLVAASGAFVAADGKVTYLNPGTAETLLPPDARPRDALWHSNASDVTYPAMWFFIVKPGHLALATVEMTHDQEIREPGRTPYYWGAIVVEKYGPPGGDSGHGFVELTGYDGRRAL